MKNIKADIKVNSYKRIYLLCGDEAYLKRKCLAALHKGVLGEDSSDVNYSYFDGNNGYDLNSLKDICETLPFFADRRLVVVENSGLFGKDNEFDIFLSNIPDSTVLILVEEKADKNTKLYKEIKKQGYVAEFTTPKPEETVQFAAGYLGKFGKRISKSDCEYLVNSVGGDLYNITSELDKVIDYSGEREGITKQDIDAVCSMQIENKIYDLVDMLMNRRAGNALKIYFDLVALREQPLGLLRYIMKQYLKFLSVRDLMDRGVSDNDIASEIHSSDWLVKKYRTKLRNYNKTRLNEAIRLCTEAEEAIKSGNISESTGFEILLANLASV